MAGMALALLGIATWAASTAWALEANEREAWLVVYSIGKHASNCTLRVPRGRLWSNGVCGGIPR